MEYFAVGFVIVLLVGFFVAEGLIENHRSKIYFRKRMQKLYGNASDKKYADGRLDSSIASVLRHADEQEFLLDDITWNDLELDRVFMAMDYTRSAAGEEALYRFLRSPKLSEAVLKDREKHFQFFAGHEKERLDYLSFMANVGRTGKYSVYDYLDYLEGLHRESPWKDVILGILLIASVALGSVCSPYFFLAMAAIMIYQSTTYVKKKKQVEPYLTTFAYFIRILGCADALAKMSREFKEEFSEELHIIEQNKHAFRSFRRFSSLAVDKNGGMGDGMDPSKILIDYLKIIFHVDLIKLYSMLDVVNNQKQLLVDILWKLGEMEACLSVAYFRAALPSYCIPSFVEKGRLYEAKELFHPLLHEPVKNDVCQSRGMLLTGSNASGKSTFLKAVAVNAVLAQSVNTVCALSYRASMFRVYSSMALRDNLSNGESYFIVEIKSLKRIFDAVDDKTPVLCTIDEVLRGTNTAERIGASTELLKELAEKNTICFAATHDIELTCLLENSLDNYHFAEMVEGKEIKFPYKLAQGSAKGRNALKLMEALGFEHALVERAEELAKGLTKA